MYKVCPGTFHNIDKIMYINLEYQTEKKKTNIENELTTFNLPFECFNAIYHPVGTLECSQSHLEVLKLAKEKDIKIF